MSTPDNKQSEYGWPKTNGMTVPEGYFEDFARRMMDRIPAEVAQTVEVRRTVWQKIRPYVYMAAMFAGIYLMLNIFSLATGMRDAVAPRQSSGTLLAEVVNSGTVTYVDDYLTVSDLDLYNDLYESGYEIPESF